MGLNGGREGECGDDESDDDDIGAEDNDDVDESKEAASVSAGVSAAVGM
jgi:hypothetical protein